MILENVGLSLRNITQVFAILKMRKVRFQTAGGLRLGPAGELLSTL